MKITAERRIDHENTCNIVFIVSSCASGSFKSDIKVEVGKWKTR